MTHIHKRFTLEQVKVLLSSYENGNLSRSNLQEVLGIGKTRFFEILKQYRTNPDSFSIEYKRNNKSRLSMEAEEKIRLFLEEEKALIDNPDLPIHTYNYSAINDRLKENGIVVSTTTVINRAKSYGCYIRQKKKTTVHDREVLTSAVGDLIQHDASIHKWSPFANEKWTLITSLDDHSRMILFADFFERETSWAHIQAVQNLMQRYGVPHRYYVDNLRVFRFVQHRDSTWQKITLGTDDVLTQWGRVMERMNTKIVYAMSPQAKGKIERPYGWLQDRLVRTCARQNISDIQEAKEVLAQEVHRYNFHQVHSTTKEIPALRFEKAIKEKRSLFRPFAVPKPFSSPKDIFCIQYQRVSNGYRKVSFAGKEFQIPGVNPYDDVEIHCVPDLENGIVELRFWCENKMLFSTFLPLAIDRIKSSLLNF